MQELASSNSTSPPPIVATVSDGCVVEYLDIFIIAVILAFSLFNLPRVLVYTANNRFEISRGYFLRSTTQFRMYRSSPGTATESKENLEDQQEYSVPTLETTEALKQWHFPMHLSLRHPAVGFIRYRILGNYTVLQVFLMVGYTAAVFCAAFYKSNPFTDPKRIGWVIVSQFPFVYAFATKNNVIGLLVGVGYEKLNYLHRHLGRLMVIGANVHALGYIYKWSLAGPVTVSNELSKPFIRWGLVALVCFDLLGFFSIQYIRTRSYNLFFGTHFAGLIVALVAAWYHRPACIPYVIAGSAVYGLDYIIRGIRTRFSTATLQIIPELGLTRVDIPSLSIGWRAGQHVRLRILSPAMGIFRMTEIHPFTISSATNTEEGLVLMCKKTGYWTRKLYEIAQTRASGEQGQEPGRKVTVMIEGPYGGVGDTTIPNYSGAMFVAGGSGMTFVSSVVQDLVLADDRIRTKFIEVVWSITDPAALQHFIPLFAALVSQNGPARVRVTVFYTRAAAYSFEGLELPPGISLSSGRPNMSKLLNGLVASVKSKGDMHGAFVAVCGPVGLNQEVARAVRTYDADSKKAIGGIQFHEEVFGL